MWDEFRSSTEDAGRIRWLKGACSIVHLDRHGIQDGTFLAKVGSALFWRPCESKYSFS